MLSAAARRVISVGGGGAPTSGDRRRRQLKVSGGGVRRREHIFVVHIFNNIEEDIKYLILCRSVIAFFRTMRKEGRIDLFHYALLTVLPLPVCPSVTKQRCLETVRDG
jgi:hypothetical protein